MTSSLKEEFSQSALEGEAGKAYIASRIDRDFDIEICSA